MKRLSILSLLCLLLCIANVRASVVLNGTNFPDQAFREYISGLTGVSVNGTISDLAIKRVTTINVQSYNITLLKGVEYFTELTELICTHNKLTSLDVSKNTKLQHLLCGNNELSSLDTSCNPELLELTCWGNHLRSLDVSKNTKLLTLFPQANQLTSLDVSKNTKLTTLLCSRNKISSLDLSCNPELVKLSCGENQITQLDLSNNPKLEQVDCNENCMTFINLDVCPNLKDSQFCQAQESTRRFTRIKNNATGNYCWTLYVGTNDASRIKYLSIDGEYKGESVTIIPGGWLVVSDDLKKIPQTVRYDFRTLYRDLTMNVTVNYDVKKYGVYVDGKELTSLNFYDIPGLKSGTAYLTDEPEGIGWSGYEPTLVLDNAKIEGVEGISNEEAYHLRIVATGDNEVTANDYNGFTCFTAVETVFSGGGTVRFMAEGEYWQGCYAFDAHVKITDGTTVIAKGGSHGYFTDGGSLGIEGNSALIAYGNQRSSVDLPSTAQRYFDANIGVRYPVGAYMDDIGRVYNKDTDTDVQKDWVLIGPTGATLPADLLGNPADVNKDGTVDSADIVAVIKEMPDGDMKADVNGDRAIDSADIVAVIKAMK